MKYFYILLFIQIITINAAENRKKIEHLQTLKKVFNAKQVVMPISTREKSHIASDARFFDYFLKEHQYNRAKNILEKGLSFQAPEQQKLAEQCYPHLIGYCMEEGTNGSKLELFNAIFQLKPNLSFDSGLIDIIAGTFYKTEKECEDCQYNFKTCLDDFTFTQLIIQKTDIEKAKTEISQKFLKEFFEYQRYQEKKSSESESTKNRKKKKKKKKKLKFEIAELKEKQITESASLVDTIEDAFQNLEISSLDSDSPSMTQNTSENLLSLIDNLFASIQSLKASGDMLKIQFKISDVIADYEQENKGLTTSEFDFVKKTVLEKISSNQAEPKQLT